jgi:Helix-turn-helix of DDE superfamily endonuclease
MRPMKGSPRRGKFTVRRSPDSPHRGAQFDQSHRGRVSAVSPPFEAAYQAHPAQWRLDGRPRTARRYTTYQNCPLPTPADRLLCILVYLKTYPLQVVQVRLFGMGRSKADQWIHVLLVVLRSTRRTLGDAPTRSVTELTTRLGVAEAEATALVVPTHEPSPLGEPPASPFWPRWHRTAPRASPEPD